MSALPRLAPSGTPRPPARIVHLGLGAFFRAHGMTYLAELGGWGVIGVSLRSASVRDRLAPQGWTYTATELAPGTTATRRIEILDRVLVAPEDPDAVLRAMADPAIAIVSLTVTEKGYCHDPATGRLDPAHPDIAADLAGGPPRSAIGFLVRALARRRADGAGPFTVLSCDNLPGNGALLRGLVLDLARRIDADLADWIASQVAFPSTMVDRIVPATSPGDIARIADDVGARDDAAVLHEPFRQWVIEDRFSGDRPDLARVGVQMVADVAPFEHMKLRMLNGAHSALAYLGALTGLKTVADAVADPVVAAYLRRLWADEVAPTLTAPPDTDLGGYADALLVRFANPALHHATTQIAMDGSQKLPQRLLATIRDNAVAPPCLLLAVAAWMRFLSGVDEAGRPLALDDPMAPRLRAALSEDPGRTVRALLAIEEIFDPALAQRIEAPLVTLYTRLRDHGARAMMERVAR